MMLDGAGGTSAQRGDEFEVFEFLVASSRYFGWIEGFATSDRRRVAPLLSSADEHHIRVNTAESGAGKGIDKNFLTIHRELANCRSQDLVSFASVWSENIMARFVESPGSE